MRILALAVFVFSILLFTVNQYYTTDSVKTEKSITVEAEEIEYKIIEFQKDLLAFPVLNIVYENNNNFKQFFLIKSSISLSIIIPPETFSFSA